MNTAITATHLPAAAAPRAASQPRATALPRPVPLPPSARQRRMQRLAALAEPALFAALMTALAVVIGIGGFEREDLSSPPATQAPAVEAQTFVV